MRYRILDTPTGPFALIVADDGTIRTGWGRGDDDPLLEGGRRDDGLEPSLTERLGACFRGEVVAFDEVATPGHGSFSARCWAACRSIPRGETRTYAQLAQMAGAAAGAARAAGQAMRRNPLPIIVPCHRVLAAGGRLGGFAGETDPGSSTVRTKRWLLDLERTGRVPAPLSAAPDGVEAVCG